MLIDRDRLDNQLSTATGVGDSSRAVYMTLAHARFRDATVIRPSGHGYIERELRYELGKDWLYAAVLNQGWVLWYVRKPALKAGLVDEAATRARFDGIATTARGELKLRLHEVGEARDVLRWIGAEAADG